MVHAYLLVNAVLYLGLAVLCTVRPGQTAKGIGFANLTQGGHSEYLVIYGGLQIGLGLFYLWLSQDPQYFRAGIIFSLLLYTPIVIYRLVTVLIHRPVGVITLGTAALEIILLLWAVVLWRKLAA